MDQPIRIIIPAFKADETIRLCINHILLAAEGIKKWEVIVVDNGLNSELEQLSNLPNVKVLKKTEFSSAAFARNEGARGFIKGIIIFIDSDVLVKEDCIRLLIESVCKNPNSAVVGNYSRDTRGLNFAQSYKQLYIHHIYDKKRDVIRNDFWTAIAALDATIFHKLEGFDISYKGANGEDQEFGIRLTKNKYSVVSVANANGKHINPYFVKGIIRNDFRKGMTVMSNSLKNKIPLNDNRHAKSGSIYAVFFAAATLFTLCFSVFTTVAISVSIMFFLFWLFYRYPLLRIYLENQNMIFTIKAIFLTYILDLVRFISVILGLINYLWTRSSNKIQQIYTS